jgi:hypothetical protein
VSPVKYKLGFYIPEDDILDKYNCDGESGSSNVLRAFGAVLIYGSTQRRIQEPTDGRGALTAGRKSSSISIISMQSGNQHTSFGKEESKRGGEMW